MSMSVTVTSVTLSVGREKVIGSKFGTKPLTTSCSSMLALTWKEVYVVQLGICERD